VPTRIRVNKPRDGCLLVLGRAIVEPLNHYRAGKGGRDAVEDMRATVCLRTSCLVKLASQVRGSERGSSRPRRVARILRGVCTDKISAASGGSCKALAIIIVMRIHRASSGLHIYSIVCPRYQLLLSLTGATSHNRNGRDFAFQTFSTRHICIFHYLVLPRST
jgi:hypothetical protein